LKKDILGANSLLYDLSMNDYERAKLVDYLGANLLLARCLHVSNTVTFGEFENSLFTVRKQS